MKNLAGHPESDIYCAQELTEAGISIVHLDERKGEVQSFITGALNGFTFSRAWYYWRASGPMPLKLAEDMHSLLGKEIRVGGHCMAPPPEGYHVKWFFPDGKEVLSIKTYNDCQEHMGGNSEPMREIVEKILKDNEFSDDPASLGAKPYVMNYHIDSQRGLNLFAKMVKTIKVA